MMMLLRRMLRCLCHLKSSLFWGLNEQNHTTRRLSKIKNPFGWPFMIPSSDCHKQPGAVLSGGMCKSLLG